MKLRLKHAVQVHKTEILKLFDLML